MATRPFPFYAALIFLGLELGSGCNTDRIPVKPQVNMPALASVQHGPAQPPLAPTKSAGKGLALAFSLVATGMGLMLLAYGFIEGLAAPWEGDSEERASDLRTASSVLNSSSSRSSSSRLY